MDIVPTLGQDHAAPATRDWLRFLTTTSCNLTTLYSIVDIVPTLGQDHAAPATRDWLRFLITTASCNLATYHKENAILRI